MRACDVLTSRRVLVVPPRHLAVARDASRGRGRRHRARGRAGERARARVRLCALGAGRDAERGGGRLGDAAVAGVRRGAKRRARRDRARTLYGR